MPKTNLKLKSAVSIQLDEKDFVKKSSFLPRLPEKFCPNKFFGRKKPNLFTEHFTFNICQHWLPTNLA